MEIRKPEEIEKDIVKLLEEVHNPKLAKLPGHVYQIWNDGELTMQKSGELLDKRIMHTMIQSLKLENISYYVPDHKVFPVAQAEMGFAYVTQEDGHRVGNLIKEFVIASIYHFHKYQ